MVHQAEKVKITEVGSRGVAFSFYEDFLGDTTYSYLINAEKHVFLFDTFCGPDSMEYIKEYLREKKIGEKPLIIVITHNHWDHYWGNCAFPEHLIISHTLCRQGMQETAQEDLERMKESISPKMGLIFSMLLATPLITYRPMIQSTKS